ncbi:MAG: FtsX-like permease family protein [Gammaproteobacteria bacterium]|nr:FtsX-like permease family protein [Gammaproteobacteria bacterium]
MNTFRLALRLLARDWRSGELVVLSTALVVAVTALTAVAFLTDRVSYAVELRAAESLAADLRLGSPNPVPPGYSEQAHDAGLDSARVTSMPSVVFSGQGNTLAAIRAVTRGYPLRGQVKTAARLLGQAQATDDIPAPGEAWAAPRLLARLGVDTGAEVNVGNTTLRISKVLDFRPDEGWSFIDLAPTLLINDADMAATGLIQPGSRVRYRLLLAGERGAVSAFKPRLEAQLSESERLQDIQDSSPQIRSAMDRSGRFLNLASLVSVLLAAVAVAMAARRYAQRHRDRIALFKCLGSSQAFILKSSLMQLILLALTGGLAGIALGYLSHAGLAWLLRDLISGQLPPPGWSPAVLGMLTSVSILSGFALPDLFQMGKTPPLRVLRHDVGPPPLRYGISWIAAIAAVLALLFWMVADFSLVMYISIGATLTFLALGLAGWILVRALQGFRGAAGVAWRYGLAKISRRGRESVVQVVAFGLGLMVLLLLTLVRNDLMSSWRASLPANAPNQFLINIQPGEVDALGQYFEQNGLPLPRFTPLVRARMTEMNGEDITQITFEDPQGESWARREANLTFYDDMQADNQLVRGQWWEPGTRANEVSVEQDFGREMGLKLGDEVTFDVAGEPVTATVTSFRTVEWDSFQPNFFMVFTPAALEGYPATYISSLYVDEQSERVIIDMMRAFPSVTAIDLDAVLGQVRDVMDKAALAVQAVFIFTLLAGLTVLWAAVQSTHDERQYESAMLRALGASRRRVLAGVAAEFLALGLLAGLLATIGATIAGYFLATRLYELEYQFNLLLTLSGPLAGMVFVGLSGILAARKVISTAPVTVLRAA